MVEAIKPHEWPERLKLRDTKVIADEGQRILTNATGYGYEQQTYVRADKFDALKAENERLKKDNYSYAKTMDAIAIVDAEAAPSPSPAPGVVEALERIIKILPGDPTTDTITTAANRLNAAIGIAAAALRALSQPAKGELPDRDTSKPAEQQGLFRKFEVRRTDGSDQPGGKHHGCRYFVIDIDHDQYATDALTAYADACARTHPELARDLREKWGAASPANPAQWVSEALSDCLDMLARFTHSTSNDLNHVEARAVYRAGRAALAAIGAGPKPPGWPDPLESPQAEAIRNGKLDDTEIRNLFDCMERELRLHRERAAGPAQGVNGLLLKAAEMAERSVALNEVYQAREEYLRFAQDCRAAIDAGGQAVAGSRPVYEELVRSRSKELHQKLGRDALLRQNDPVQSIYDFAWSIWHDGFGEGMNEAALTHPAPSGQAVAVKAKPLEWTGRNNDGTIHIAHVVPTEYWAWELAGFGYWSWGTLSGREVLGGIEEAKAAAQADYERRIKSALAHPVQPGWRDIAEDQPAPPHDTPVLLWSPPSLSRPNGEYEARPFSTGRSGPGWSEYSQHSWATHWMPLPAAPQPKGE